MRLSDIFSVVVLVAAANDAPTESEIAGIGGTADR
jgi:hypothetical protein